MSDSETGAAVIAPAVPEATPAAPPAAPARRGLGLFWLVSIVLLGAAGYGLWLLQQQRAAVAHTDAAWQRESTALQQRIDVLEQALRGAEQQRRTLEQRLDDLASGSKILREEMLGVADRAAVLEDALARLARRREDAELALRLNEVDYLLQLGEERLRLFGDIDAARQAFALADASLATVEEPSYAALRQSLQIEREALRQAPADPRPGLRQLLGEALAAVDALPAANTEPANAAVGESRLRQLLANLITVRRLDEAGALNPLQRAQALAALKLQLGLAQAALERRDSASWQASVDAALGAFDRLFAATAETTALRQRLQAARDTALAATPPELGASLRELRALRTTRALGSAAPVERSREPAPAVEVAPAVEADPGPEAVEAP